VPNCQNVGSLPQYRHCEGGNRS